MNVIHYGSGKYSGELTQLKLVVNKTPLAIILFYRSSLQKEPFQMRTGMRLM